MPAFDAAYVLMVTDQAPPDVIAKWLQNDLFKKYVEKRRKEFS